MGWFETKTRSLTAGGKTAYCKASDRKNQPGAKPVLASALSIVLMACFFLLVMTQLAQFAGAADPGHAASSVSAGTFESGDFTFPVNLTVNKFFIANGTTLYVDALNRRVGIGTASPTQKLEVSGTVNASDFVCSSAGCINAVEVNADVAGDGLASSSGVLAISMLAGGGIVTSSDSLSLNRSCGSGQLLKWNSSSSYWYCADDSGLTSESDPRWSGNASLVRYKSEELNWSNLTGYVAACAAGSALTQLADVPVCSAFQTGSELVNTTEEMQDAVGGAFDTTLNYTDASNLMGVNRTWIYDLNKPWTNTLGYNNLSKCGTGQILEMDGGGTNWQCGTDDGAGWTVSGGYVYNNTAAALVGIGTAAPTAKLHVNSSSASGSLLVQNTTGSSHLFVNGSSGNVGIGTASPGQLLEVAGNLGLKAGDLKMTTVGVGNSFTMDDGAAYTGTVIYQIIRQNPGVRTSYYDNLQFGTYGGSEAMRIVSTGNVGINTTSPAQTLNVRGTFNVTNTTGTLGLIQTANANVGIGTASPGAYLNVKGATSPQLIVEQPGGGSTISIRLAETSANYWETAMNFVGNSGAYTIGYNGDTKFTINRTNGNVGIGTASPTTKLDVNGSLNITDTGGRIRTPELCLTGDTCRTTWPTGGGGGAGDKWVDGGNYIYPNTTYADNVVVYGYLNVTSWLNVSNSLFVNGSSGKVGIGTAAPGYLLHVSTNSSSVTQNVFFQNLDANAGFNVLIGQNATKAFFVGYYGSGEATYRSLIPNTAFFGSLSGAAQIAFNTQGASPIIFATDNWVERMRIQPTTGNVGIGTVSPTTKLDVNGSLNITDTGGRIRTPELCLTADSCRTTWPTGGGGGAGDKWVDGGNYIYPNTTYADNVVVYGYLNVTNWLNVSNSLFVNGSSGNVGIGTTGPGYKLDINNSGTSTQMHVSTNTGDSGLYFTAYNADSGYMSGGSAWNGTNWIAKSTGATIVGASGGTFGVWTDSALTAGNQYTPSRRLAIDSSGNVGINTTSPAALLDIRGPTTAGSASGSSDYFYVNRYGTTLKITGFGSSHANRPATTQFGALNSEQNIAIVTDDLAAIDAGTSTKGIFIKTGGNVGINTTSPSYKLHVVESVARTNPMQVEIRNGDTAVGYNYGIYLKNNDNTNNDYTSIVNYDANGNGNAWIDFINVDHSTPKGAMALTTRNGGTYTRRMYIDEDGNVGIGVTDPKVTFQGLTSGSTSRFGTQTRTDGANIGGIAAGQLARFGGWYSTNPIAGSAIDLAAQGGSGQRGAIGFLTKATDDDTNQPTLKMVIDQTGNVGIGTAAPTHTLNVRGTLNVTGNALFESGLGSRADYGNFKGVVPLSGLDEGAAIIDSQSWKMVTRTTYSTIASMFPAALDPGATRRYFLLIRKADNIASDALYSYWRFYASWDILGAHAFNVSRNWGAQDEGMQYYIEIPATAVTGSGCSTCYWRLDARLDPASESAGSKMYVFGVWLAAYDQVGASTPSFVNISNNSAATEPTISIGTSFDSTGTIFKTSAGNVGIGTASPDHKLTVKADGSQFATVHNNGIYATQIYTYDGMALISMRSNDTWDEKLRITAGGPTWFKAPDDVTYGQLTLNSTGSDARLELYNSNGASATGRGSILMSKTSGYEGMRFMTNNADKMIIDENGNVGIGTVSPTYHLQVESANNNQFQVTGQGTGYGGTLLANIYSERTTASPATDLLLKVGSAYAPNAFGVFGTGYVGIGTTAPASLLEINQSGASSAAILRVFQPALSDGQYAQIYLGKSAGTNAAGTISYVPSATAASSTLRLGIYGSSDTLAIDGNGYVGIGTAAPKTRLHVTTGTADSYPTLGTSSGNLFLGSDNSLYGLYEGSVGADGNSWLQVMRNDAATAYNLILQPVGGNVGIGTTTPQATLDLGAATGRRLYIYNSGTIREGMGVDLASGPRELSIFHATTGTDGFLTFGSQTDGTTTFNEKMRLTGAGNVGIGTVTANERLNVSGNVTISDTLKSSTGNVVIQLG